MKKVALLVGVEQYQDEHITPLRFAGADVRALAEELRARCGFNHVRVLAEGDARRVAGRSGTCWMPCATWPASCGTDDLFFFFFSGHGVEVDGQATC